MVRWTSSQLTTTGLWCFCIGLARAATLVPAPIVVQPSQYWEGDDGSWSTFSLRVGSPEQVVRVLVSTAIPNAVTVVNSSCPQGATSSCASSRGGVFAPNSSSTWQYRNTFGLYPELNYTTQEEPAYYGLDTIGLGIGGASAGTTLKNQVVAAVQSTDYYLGYLGIDPQATNWTLNFSDETESFFKTLSTQSLIPSFTYSYTAGAQYRFKGVLGSMVFGGYDSSRVTPQENVVFTMADDVSRDLVVAIQSITADTSKGSEELLPDAGILAFIDSTFPYFVLPFDTCEAFETQFGLQWNPKAGPGGLYTLTDTQHKSLLTSNPNITFTLGNSLSGGPVTKITLPYAAFDLQASPPLVNSTTRYFPLLRASNATQITLGRAFLQEAMLIVDYAQGNFSVWPCVWNADATGDIIALAAHNASNPNSNSGTAVNGQGTSQQRASQLSLGLGLGLGVGIPLLALIAFTLIARQQRSWPFRARPWPHEQIPMDRTGTELGGKAQLPHEADKGDIYEADGSKRQSKALGLGSGAQSLHEQPPQYSSLVRPELAGTPGASRPELAGHMEPNRPELAGNYGRPRPELAGSEAARELYDPHAQPSELPGGPVASAYLQNRAQL